MIRAAILCSGLSGCVTLPHTVERVLINAQVVEIHTDAPADPCPDLVPGCYEFASRRVYLRSPVKHDTRKHEIAHAAGMRHGPWRHYPAIRMSCAIVWVAGGGYELGQAICVDSGGERVIAATVLES